MDGCLTGAVCLGVSVVVATWLVGRAFERARALLVTAAILVVGLGLACAGAAWWTMRAPLVVGVNVPPPAAAVEVQVEVDVDVERPVGPRAITDAELTELVLDLHTRTFSSDRLALLRRVAHRWRFTPEQGARVLLCFDFDRDRLAALEVLEPRLLPGDRGALVARFDEAFGQDLEARLVLGE